MTIDPNTITISFAYLAAIFAAGLAGMAVYRILSYLNTRNKKDKDGAAICTAGAVINILLVFLAIGSALANHIARIG